MPLILPFTIKKVKKVKVTYCQLTLREPCFSFCFSHFNRNFRALHVLLLEKGLCLENNNRLPSKYYFTLSEMGFWHTIATNYDYSKKGPKCSWHLGLPHSHLCFPARAKVAVAR